MPTNPILDLAVLLDLVLNFLQREQPALESRKLALEHLQTVDAGAALPVQGLPRRLELGEQRFLAGKLGTALRQLLREAHRQLRVGCNQLGPLGEQFLLALLQPLQRLARMLEVRLCHLERLLGVGDALALAGDPSLEQAGRLLGLRHFELLLGVLAPGLLQSVSRLLEARLPGQPRIALLDLALSPGVALRAKLRKLCVETLPGIGHEAYFGFKAGDVGVDSVELPLRGAQCVSRSVMLRARALELELDFAQPRGLGFELGRAALDFARMPLRLRLRIVATQEPQQILLLCPVGRKLVVPSRDFGLLFQPLDLRLEFLADVAQAREVVAGVGEAMFGFAAPLLVLGHSRRFLQKYAQFLGFRFDDARDHPLLDDGVGTRAQARAEENVLHVASAYVGIIDEIGGFAVPLQHTLHRDLGVLGPLAGRSAETVVEEQLHARPRHGLSQRRAVEDHILHRVAAQSRGARLPEYPPDSVDNVRLPASVRTDHADQLPRNAHRGRIDEGLEPGELDLCEPHASRRRYESR